MGNRFTVADVADVADVAAEIAPDDIPIRPVLPRLVGPATPAAPGWAVDRGGDRQELGGTVHAATSAESGAEVTLQLLGMTSLDAPALQPQP